MPLFLLMTTYPRVHAYNGNRNDPRIAGIIEHFERLKSKIDEWENSLKNRAVPAIELNWQFASFSIVIRKLSNQALLARVSISICGAISSLKDVIE